MLFPILVRSNYCFNSYKKTNASICKGILMLHYSISIYRGLLLDYICDMIIFGKTQRSHIEFQFG